MTVLNEILKATGVGNGSSTVFSFSPIVLPTDADDLVVTKVGTDGTQTPLTRGTGATNYSVTPTGPYPSTGSITYPATGSTRLAVGEKVIMRRLLDLLQETDLENLGGYFPDTQEGVFDRLTMILQQQQEQINRSLKLPVAETGADANTNMPSEEDGPGFLYRNDDNEYVMADGVSDTAVSAFMATFVDDANADAGLSTLGFSTFVKTLKAAADAAAYRALIGAGVGDVVNPMSASGDIIYGGASGVPTRLAKGTDGQQLQLSGGVPTWQTPAAGAGTLIGEIKDWAGRSAPTDYLFCYGQAISRSTYSSLFAITNPSLGTFTVTIASPAVFTLTAHGLSIGDKLQITTTGALPTGLAENTTYYVLTVPSADTFTVSTSDGGSAVNTSGSQSGTHTARFGGFGIGDGTTTFNLPDYRGRVSAAPDNMGGTAASRLTTGTGGAGQSTGIGKGLGAQSVTLTTAELASHTHGSVLVSATASNTLSASSPDAVVTSTTSGSTGSAGSGNAHANVQPTILVPKIIKVQ